MATESHTALIWFRWRASFIQLGGPVENDRHRLRLGLLDWCDDQKSLTVPADIVNEQVIDWDWLPGIGLKKGHRRAGIKVGAGRHRNGHNLTVRRKVEQFFSVATPAWLFAPSNRDLPLAAWL